MAPGCVVHVVGARPNFVKMAPVIAALERPAGRRQRVVHTGQHYDERMSAEMLSDLEFPEPDVFLGRRVRDRTARRRRALLEAFERVLLDERPDLVCVGGDVNSTLAVALAAAKLGIPVAHVEAGLRSFDWTMPEEINRVLTDRLSDLLFTHSPEAATNLAAEGIDAERVHFVGNTMIDSLRRFEATRRGPPAVGGARRRSAASTCSSPCIARPTSTTAGQLRRVVAALAALAADAARRSSPSIRARRSACGPKGSCPASRAPACAAWSRSATSTSSASRSAPARS